MIAALGEAFRLVKQYQEAEIGRKEGSSGSSRQINSYNGFDESMFDPEFHCTAKHQREMRLLLERKLIEFLASMKKDREFLRRVI